MLPQAMAAARKSNRIIQFQYKEDGGDDDDDALRPKHTHTHTHTYARKKYSCQLRRDTNEHAQEKGSFGVIVFTNKFNFMCGTRN